VKIDVEGAELEVLLGLKGVLQRDRPLVLMEVLPTYGTDESRQRRQRLIEQMLGEIDYSIARIRKGQDDSFKGLEILEQIGDHSDVNSCDYVCVPREALTRSLVPGVWVARNPIETNAS